MRDEFGRFVPGVSGNPGGRVPLEGPLKEKLDKAKLIAKEALSDALSMEFESFLEKANNPKSPMIYRMIATLMTETSKKGNTALLKEICDRVLGKAVTPIELTGADGGALSVSTGLEHFTDEQIRFMAENIVKKRLTESAAASEDQ